MRNLVLALGLSLLAACGGGGGGGSSPAPSSGGGTPAPTPAPTPSPAPTANAQSGSARTGVIVDGLVTILRRDAGGGETVVASGLRTDSEGNWGPANLGTGNRNGLFARVTGDARSMFRCDQPAGCPTAAGPRAAFGALTPFTGELNAPLDPDRPDTRITVSAFTELAYQRAIGLGNLSPGSVRQANSDVAAALNGLLAPFALDATIGSDFATLDLPDLTVGGESASRVAAVLATLDAALQLAPELSGAGPQGVRDFADTFGDSGTFPTTGSGLIADDVAVALQRTLTGAMGQPTAAALLTTAIGSQRIVDAIAAAERARMDGPRIGPAVGDDSVVTLRLDRPSDIFASRNVFKAVLLNYTVRDIPFHTLRLTTSDPDAAPLLEFLEDGAIAQLSVRVNRAFIEQMPELGQREIEFRISAVEDAIAPLRVTLRIDKRFAGGLDGVALTRFDPESLPTIDIRERDDVQLFVRNPGPGWQFEWSQANGPAVEIRGATTSRASVTIPELTHDDFTAQFVTRIADSYGDVVQVPLEIFAVPHAELDELGIADPALAACVRAAATSVGAGDAGDIQSLDCNDPVVDLSGLDALANLRSLRLRGPLTSIRAALNLRMIELIEIVGTTAVSCEEVDQLLQFRPEVALVGAGDCSARVATRVPYPTQGWLTDPGSDDAFVQTESRLIRYSGSPLRPESFRAFDGTLKSVVAAPDGSVLYATVDPGTLHLIDPVSLRTLRQHALPGRAARNPRIIPLPSRNTLLVMDDSDRAFELHLDSGVSTDRPQFEVADLLPGLALVDPVRNELLLLGRGNGSSRDNLRVHALGDPDLLEVERIPLPVAGPDFGNGALRISGDGAVLLIGTGVLVELSTRSVRTVAIRGNIIATSGNRGFVVDTDAISHHLLVIDTGNADQIELLGKYPGAAPGDNSVGLLASGIATRGRHELTSFVSRANGGDGTTPAPLPLIDPVLRRCATQAGSSPITELICPRSAANGVATDVGGIDALEALVRIDLRNQSIRAPAPPVLPSSLRELDLRGTPLTTVTTSHAPGLTFVGLPDNANFACEDISRAQANGRSVLAGQCRSVFARTPGVNGNPASTVFTADHALTAINNTLRRVPYDNSQAVTVLATLPERIERAIVTPDGHTAFVTIRNSNSAVWMVDLPSGSATPMLAGAVPHVLDRPLVSIGADQAIVAVRRTDAQSLLDLHRIDRRNATSVTLGTIEQVAGGTIRMLADHEGSRLFIGYTDIESGDRIAAFDPAADTLTELAAVSASVDAPVLGGPDVLFTGADSIVTSAGLRFDSRTLAFQSVTFLPGERGQVPGTGFFVKQGEFADAGQEVLVEVDATTNQEVRRMNNCNQATLTQIFRVDAARIGTLNRTCVLTPGT